MEEQLMEYLFQNVYSNRFSINFQFDQLIINWKTGRRETGSSLSCSRKSVRLQISNSINLKYDSSPLINPLCIMWQNYVESWSLARSPLKIWNENIDGRDKRGYDKGIVSTTDYHSRRTRAHSTAGTSHSHASLPKHKFWLINLVSALVPGEGMKNSERANCLEVNRFFVELFWHGNHRG